MSLAEQTTHEADTATISASIRTILDKQKAAHIKDGPASAERRIDWINRAIALVVDNQKEIAEALASDFGHRSHEMKDKPAAWRSGFDVFRQGRELNIAVRKVVYGFHQMYQ